MDARFLGSGGAPFHRRVSRLPPRTPPRARPRPSIRRGGECSAEPAPASSGPTVPGVPRAFEPSGLRPHLPRLPRLARLSYEHRGEVVSVFHAPARLLPQPLRQPRLGRYERPPDTVLLEYRVPASRRRSHLHV